MSKTATTKLKKGSDEAIVNTRECVGEDGKLKKDSVWANDGWAIDDSPPEPAKEPTPATSTPAPAQPVAKKAVTKKIT